jgi:hypothetical protein
MKLKKIRGLRLKPLSLQKRWKRRGLWVNVRGIVSEFLGKTNNHKRRHPSGMESLWL